MSTIASGRQLRAARTVAGLTQSELSTEAGFNPRACRYWESRGDNPPTSVPQSVERIVQVLLKSWCGGILPSFSGLPRRLNQVDPGGIIGTCTCAYAAEDLR